MRHFVLVVEHVRKAGNRISDLYDFQIRRTLTAHTRHRRDN